MKRNNFTKFFSAFLAFAMVLSLLTPFTASANAEKAKPFKRDNHSESIMQQKAAIAEQLNLLDGGSKLHKDLQGVTGKGQVAVIVHLSEKPVALEQGIKELAGKKFTATEATTVRKKVKSQQTAMKKEMQVKNISFTEKFAYDTVLNGFSATVQVGDLEKLLAIKGVTLIEPDTEVHAFEAPTSSSSGTVDANMNTSISFLGIEELWAEGIEGQGIKVAVLDTGIDKDHPDFAGIYKGGKNFIPNSATYTGTRADNDASETSPVERPAGTPEFNANGSAFYTSHGTHVAGTIAAIGANPYGVKGIAPKVDLYAYRVLGAYGSGSTSGIIAAIEESVKQKMDVINLSLGGGANSETDGGSFAINNAMMAGTISVIATGNSGPKRGTMGTPSTARLGIAVGNTTNPEANFDSNVNVTVGDYQLSKTINLMGTTFGADLATQLSGEYEVLSVPGMGTKADYNGLDVNGKVALVSRGEIAFVDKIAIAKEAGAIAILIHNFAGGSNAPNASGTFLGDAFEFIPAYDLSQTDGDAIRAALKSGQGTVTFGNFNKTMTIGDDVNDSSSRGPSTPNFDIKPDVSAPGTNIMSTIPMYKADFPAASYEEAFTRKTGTSMATPHIAGIAALVKQANPGWSAFDVKVALSNSAKVLDTTKYDVMSQGAGRVQAYAAAHPTILAYALDEAVLDTSGEIVDNIKGTVTFGPQSIKENNISVTKDILVKDMKGNGGNYNVTVDVTKSFEDAKVTVDKSAFTLNGEQLLTVTLTASKKANAPPGSEILGYIHIDGEGTEVSLPFAAEFGGAPASAFENFAITETDLSFNNDGIKDSAVLSFKLTGDVTTNYIELWDIMDPEGGEYGDGYIGYLHAGASLAAGSYTLNVAGNYKPWTEGAAQTTIPDGLYTIDFTGQTVSGEPAILSGYVGPIVVKSEAGTIEGALKGTTVTGKIIDKYIDYQAELVNYDLGFDVNTKLKASYEVMENDTVKSSGPVKLAQDGSFTFDVGTLTKENSVKVKYIDAAGNAAEHVVFGDDAGETPIDVKPLDPVPSEPVAADHPYVKTFGLDNVAISSKSKSNFAYEFKEAPNSSVSIIVLDPAHFTDEPNEWNEIGDIFWDSSKPQAKTGVFDGTYTNKKTNKKDKLKDGVYGIELFSMNNAYKTMSAIINPVFVKSTAPEITITAEEDTISGTIKDKFIDYKSTVKQHFNKEYDINTYLGLTAIVVNEDGGKTENNIKLEQDGTFSAALKGLAGESTVTIVAQDIAKNVAQKTVKMTGEEAGVVEISVDKENLALQIGGTENLKVTETTTKADGTKEDKDVTAEATFTSADEKIATVKNGAVTAITAGKTEITVSYKEFTAKIAVEVTAKAGQDQVTYAVSKTNLTIGVGQQEQLFVTQKTTKADGSVVEKDVTGTVNYDVVNGDIATFEKGLITALAAGKTQARVMVPGQEDIYVYLEVTAAPQDLITYSVSKKNLTLGVGQSEQFYVTQTTTKPDGTVTEKDVTGNGSYNAVNNKVATVKKGLVTALAEGQTQVRVMIPNQEVIYVYIEVVKLPQNIITYKVNKTNMKMQVGDQVQLKVTETTLTPKGQTSKKDVTATTAFKVVNNTIAKVQKGLVTAIAGGKTQVLVTIPNQDPILVYLDVKGNVITYSVDKNSVALKAGATEQLTVIEKTTKADGSVTEKNVTADSKFKSGDPKVVTLNKGLVTAVGPGETVITVTHPNFTTTVTAIVEQDVITYSVDKNSVALKAGATEQLTVTETTTKADGSVTKKNVTADSKFKSADPKVVTLSKGLVTAVGSGETVISVTHPNFTTTVTAIVEQDVIITTELIANPAALELVVGESSRISVQSIETKNGEVTPTEVTESAAYSGFDSAVIDVQQGQIIAVGAGETTITASYGNDVATIFVKVEAASIPEVPEIPEAPGAQKYIVSEAEIAAYVNDKKAKEIFIAIPANEEEIAIEFNSTILNTIVNAKKGLVVTRGDTSFLFSKKAVEKLMQQAGGNATITLSETNASSIADAISENFIVNLEGGTGDNRFGLNQFNEKIKIVLPIDASKVIKNNKVAVRDLNSTNTIKAKYNNGTLEFTATGPGSFVVVNTSTANGAGNFVAISY